MFLKRATRIHLIMETNERGNSKEKERRMLQSRKREKISHVNIVRKKAMMKNTVGSFILSANPSSLATMETGRKRKLRLLYKIWVQILVTRRRSQRWVVKVIVLLQVLVLLIKKMSM